MCTPQYIMYTPYITSPYIWRLQSVRNYINTPVVVNETARELGLQEYDVLKGKVSVYFSTKQAGALLLFSRFFCWALLLVGRVICSVELL